jgi:hypothetical protein
MAKKRSTKVTKKDVVAALEHVITLLESVKAAVGGAACEDGHVVFNVRPIPDWSGLALAVGRRGGCGCLQSLRRTSLAAERAKRQASSQPE